MYNPYFNTFGGYYSQPPPSPVLPQQQITQVSGKASVDTIQLAPNSSLLAMDTTAPIVWMCVSDGVGKVTATAYDITIHQEKPPVDVNDIVQRVTNVEKSLFELEVKLNASTKSDVSESKPKQNYYSNKTNNSNA